MLINLLLWIVYGYLSFWAAYFLFFGIAGHLHHTRPTGRSWNTSFLVLIPAYKEDSVIIDSAQNAAQHNYPQDMYDVVVIADSLSVDTAAALRELPVNVLEVQFEKSTKSKALNAALASTSKEYDAVVVLDADNHMQPDFLSKMATKLNRGALAIQGHRTAKNTNTNLALLDAVSEEINNHIFRLGHRKVGLSSALIGSAMAFDYKLFKEIMEQVEAIGGFDRELELRLIRRGISIDYLHDAYVLDEKVQQRATFEKQRKRWLAAQLHYFKRFALSGLVALLKGRIDYANKVIQGIQVPRLLLPGFLFIFGVLSATLALTPSWVYWSASLLATVVSLLLAIPRRLYNRQLLHACANIPSSFLSMALLLVKLNGANKSFIHTTHGQFNTKDNTPKETSNSH
jgi:cellulose synthase/poly-beta-1,6-N-acetylglucosamine synthase-like glycosyltransferase